MRIWFKGVLYNDALAFEWLYKNGVKTGRVIEYIGSQYLFDGDYINGKINGTAKKYNYNGKLIFNGEYLGEEKHGKAEEYVFWEDYYLKVNIQIILKKMVNYI